MLAGMSFTRAVAGLPAFCPTTAFRFAGECIEPAWIEEALQATHKASIRRRKLPAEAVLWLVLAMALFRDRSVLAVATHLGLIQDRHAPQGRARVVPASVAQARARVGPEPMAWLFHKTADTWGGESADAHRWHGLAVRAMDGTCLRVPDTPENEEAFGRPKTSRGLAAYPQLRLIAVSAPRTHLLVDLVIGAFFQGEVTLAASAWDRLPDFSVMIVDRSFLDYGTLYHLHQSGTERHWLVRAKRHLRWRVLRKLGEGDDLVEVKTHSDARKRHPDLPKTIILRAIRYQLRGFPPQILLTSMVDAAAYPAADVVLLYHERWEIELGFDEKKTHLLQRQETLRSKTPDGVRQEVWGLGLAFNLVRLLMAQVAQKVGLPPHRISFWNTVLLVRNFAVTAWDVAPGTLPALLRRLMQDLLLLVLPERRPRSNPRAVKIKISNYPRKLPKPIPENATEPAPAPLK